VSLVEVTQDFLTVTPQIPFRAPGLAVGSRWIGGTFDTKSGGSRGPFVPEDLARVIVFQTWAAGQDTAGLVDLATGRIWSIDHAAYGSPGTIPPTPNAGPNGVYVDEVYLSSPASQTFQTFDLDRIEVLKGPQGTLYGRNTSGGAINFITAKPTDTLAGHLHVEYSSFNTVNIEGALSGPLAPGWDARIAFVKNNSEGYFHNLLNGATRTEPTTTSCG
jgi:outer membrane receptor protein involved in Fe transport